MNATNIGWADYSVNPLKMQLPDGALLNVCIHKSDGCRHCYAEFLVKRWWNTDRYGEFPGYTAALLKLGKPVIVDKELQAVIRLDRRIAAGKLPKNGNKIFWNDMTDEFLDYWPDELIDKCWAVRALTPNLIHQVLTKRADRLCSYLKGNVGLRIQILLQTKVANEKAVRLIGQAQLDAACAETIMPIPNVHVGISAEDQKNFDERWPDLRKTPAALRWVSFEPLLEPIETQMEWWEDLTDFVWPEWCVIGGESGAGHRTMDLEAFKDLVDRCRTVGKVFVKQDSGARPGQQGRIPDNLWLKEFPV